uniref:Uncharacterized protein n=1 Tax=Arundo donax TaxID=35708 RepID=A0A0A9A1X8_ARUDO
MRRVPIHEGVSSATNAPGELYTAGAGDG